MGILLVAIMSMLLVLVALAVLAFSIVLLPDLFDIIVDIQNKIKEKKK